MTETGIRAAGVTTGLRELNKRRTRTALSASALHLVIKEGLEALTASRVAAIAGVSRRTVFNYFPRLEDVLIAGIEEATAELWDVFLARPADEPVRDSLKHILLNLDSEFMRQGQLLERVAQQSPRTRRIVRDMSDAQTETLEAALLQRLGPDADPLYAAGLAAATVAVLTRVIRMSAPDGDLNDQNDQHGEIDTGDDGRVLHDRMRQAIDLLFSGFDEAGARTGARED